MFGFGGEGAKRPAILMSTLKTVAIIGFLSFCASSWLSNSGLDQQGLARLARAQPNGSDDPVTTGSIGRAAGSTRLDPCTGRPRP